MDSGAADSHLDCIGRRSIGIARDAWLRTRFVVHGNVDCYEAVAARGWLRSGSRRDSGHCSTMVAEQEAVSRRKWGRAQLIMSTPWGALTER